MSDEQQTARDTRRLGAWQRKLLPFMTYMLAAVALAFFLGSLWNYSALTETLRHEDPPIKAAVESARKMSPDMQFADWYVRSVLEERALTGRQRQYNAIVQARLWTRLMGFLAGMVMVVAGSVFVLGKLDAQFDGSVQSTQVEGAVKTNSPGLVLVIAGTILLVISLVTTVDVHSRDSVAYLPAFTQPATSPTNRFAEPPEVASASWPAPTPEEAAVAAERQARMCEQSSDPKPPECAHKPQ